MTIDTLINRLNKVKQTNHLTWIACCPAHDDRNPSLAIRQIDDGRTLIHCFAGCTPNEIVGSIGLSLQDLYPEKNQDATYKPFRKIFDAHTSLQLLKFESLLVLECARTINRGELLNYQDRDRLFKAAERIQRVCEAGGLV
ncbi:DNA primase [Polynucleobacter tropicus]|uniref:DNA primase n=1 Tax=Polynucleobacter tropicus TaxID=1743174 RepID=A0A6M9PZ72_9BURK|nr:DNA primase [Polynucleobacter tropicus]QKM64648.1 DNA primase [Polynucleobacter tropicus]